MITRTTCPPDFSTATTRPAAVFSGTPSDARPPRATIWCRLPVIAMLPGDKGGGTPGSPGAAVPSARYGACWSAEIVIKAAISHDVQRDAVEAAAQRPGVPQRVRQHRDPVALHRLDQIRLVRVHDREFRADHEQVHADPARAERVRRRDRGVGHVGTPDLV